MPDTQTSSGSKNSFGFLTRKLGPAPLWLWALLAVGAYYLYTKYKGGSSSASTDPTQVVDPATGVTYAQELSDAQDQITQLQAQINQQAQGQTAPTTIDITQTQTQTGGEPEGTGGEVTVPNVIGLPRSQAGRVLQSKGLLLRGNGAPTAKVNSQTPGPNKKAKRGSTVDVGFEQSTGTTNPGGKNQPPTITNPGGPNAPSPTQKIPGQPLGGSGAAPGPIPVDKGPRSPTTKNKAKAKPKRTAATTLTSVPTVKKAA